MRFAAGLLASLHNLAILGWGGGEVEQRGLILLPWEAEFEDAEREKNG